MTYWGIPGRNSTVPAVAVIVFVVVPAAAVTAAAASFRLADMTAVPKTETGVPLPMRPKQESPVILSSNEALEFEDDADES